MKLNKYSIKYLFLFFCILTINSSYCQETFIVNNFSDDYYGKLYISDTTEVFSKGWIAIYNQKTNKQLIKVEADELTFSLHDGEVKANIQELPYGEQSQIIYEDFNFDGIKDFALMDGQNSCYHGPSFEIYLATGKGFKFSPGFTALAQEYCGMFDVDDTEKQLHTMTKSGCCWHQYSDFIVRDNSPVAIKIVEEQLHPTGIMWDYTRKDLINGKMVEQTYSLFDSEGEGEEADIIYYFEFNNGKKMRLLKKNDFMFYVFTDKDDKVELFYMDSFYYSKTKNSVWFTSGKIRYEITSSGIMVTTPNKKLNMSAKPETKKGSLSVLQKTGFENVYPE